MTASDWISVAAVILTTLGLLGAMLQWFVSRFLLRFEKLVDTVNKGFEQNSAAHAEVRERLVLVEDRFLRHIQSQGAHDRKVG